MNIEQLPANVLTKIFSYVHNRKVLRAVSKHFKMVLNSSPKLMRKYGLNMDEMDEKPEIQFNYQLLKLKELDFEEFKRIHYFQGKNKVKEIYIGHGDQIEKSVWFMQGLLANFSNLQTLHFGLNMDTGKGGEGLLSTLRIKLLPNELSKLETLIIDCHTDLNLDCLLYMFADIPSIKKIALLNSWCGPEFPQNVAWKLEELNMSITDWRDDFVNGCKKLLKGQKSTLKVLRNDFSENICNFVMHNLPDLEVLHLRIRADKQICDDIEANEKLKSLSLISFPDDEDKILEKVLRHYKNIQYLNIRPYGDRMVEDLFEGQLEPKNVELLSLTHLSLNGLVGTFLLGVQMPNLKFLEIYSYDNDCEYDYYFDDERFNDENFANVEKLSVKGISMDGIYAMVQKCPKLQHLNLETVEPFDDDDLDMCDCCEFHTEEDSATLKKILEKAPQLSHLGILKGDLKLRKKIEDLFFTINKRRLVIKVYGKFEDMMKAHWPINMIADYYSYYPMFVKCNGFRKKS